MLAVAGGILIAVAVLLALPPVLHRVTRVAMWLASALVLVLTVTGCGGSTGPSALKPSFAVVAGDHQTGDVATQLPVAIVVKVVGPDSQPVANQPVSFVPLNGGQMFAGFNVTNAQGEVRDYWTLGDGAGGQQLEARAVDPTTGEQLVFDHVTATATPAEAADISVQQVNVAVTVGDSVDVRPYIQKVVDRFDNPLGAGDYALTTRIDNTPIGGTLVTAYAASPYVTITQAGDNLVWVRADSIAAFFHATGQ